MVDKKRPRKRIGRKVNYDPETRRWWAVVKPFGACLWSDESEAELLRVCKAYEKFPANVSHGMRLIQIARAMKDCTLSTDYWEPPGWEQTS